MLTYRYSYADREIADGLAPFLRGQTLRDSCAFPRPVGTDREPMDSDLDLYLANGDRPFVVIARRGGLVVLTPIFSEAKAYRRTVSAKDGHPNWVHHPTNFDPRQVWVVPVDAVITAAGQAGDRSAPGCRNRVLPGELAEMRDAIRRAAQRGHPPKTTALPIPTSITGITTLERMKSDETPRAA